MLQSSAVAQALQLLQEAQAYVAAAAQALRLTSGAGLRELQALAERISCADRRASDISALARWAAGAGRRVRGHSCCCGGLVL
jgi:hypothetical protein